MSTTGPRRPRLGGAARPTGVESCCPTGARASARRSPACRGEASRRHRSRSERRPGTRIHPRCDRPDVVGRPTLPVVRGDAHRGTKQRAPLVADWRMAARISGDVGGAFVYLGRLRHPTRENRLVRRLGDFGGCVRQLGRFGSSTEDRDGHIIPVGFDRDDDPPLARAADDRRPGRARSPAHAIRNSRRSIGARGVRLAVGSRQREESDWLSPTVPLGRGSSNGRARSDPQRVDGRSTGARLGAVAAGRGSRGEPKGSSSPRVPRV